MAVDVFNILRHKWDDEVIKGVTWGRNEDPEAETDVDFDLLFNVDIDKLDYNCGFYLDKTDAVAIARHFKLIEW